MKQRFAVGLLVLGVVVVAHPLYLPLHPGQTAVYADFVATEPGACNDGIPYEELTAANREAFEAAAPYRFAGPSHELWPGTHDRSIEQLRSNDCVVRDGEQYRIHLLHVDDAIGFWLRTLGAWLLLAVGFLLAAFGGWTLYRNR